MAGVSSDPRWSAWGWLVPPTGTWAIRHAGRMSDQEAMLCVQNIHRVVASRGSIAAVRKSGSPEVRKSIGRDELVCLTYGLVSGYEKPFWGRAAYPWRTSGLPDFRTSGLGQ